METTLHALGGILLKALPTFLLVILLHFYLKRVFFRPLEQVFDKRYEASEGARRLAELTLEKASQKASEYQARIRAARSDIYKGQEEFRRKWRQEHAAALAEARHNARQVIEEARAQLAAEAVEAGQALRAESEALADQIARSILHGRVS